MGTAVPVVPSSAGAACTVAGIVNPLIRCQCCPAVPTGITSSSLQGRPWGRCSHQAHFVPEEEEEAVMTAGGDTMEAGVLCASGGRFSV